MSGGYQASSSAISQAANTISDEATQMQQKLKDLAPTTITAADFGQAHTQHQADYKAAVDQLGAGVQGMSATLTTFASTLATGGSVYGQGEADNTATLQNSGGN